MPHPIYSKGSTIRQLLTISLQNFGIYLQFQCFFPIFLKGVITETVIIIIIIFELSSVFPLNRGWTGSKSSLLLFLWADGFSPHFSVLGPSRPGLSKLCFIVPDICIAFSTLVTLTVQSLTRLVNSPSRFSLITTYRFLRDVVNSLLSSHCHPQ